MATEDKFPKLRAWAEHARENGGPDQAYLAESFIAAAERSIELKGENSRLNAENAALAKVAEAVLKAVEDNEGGIDPAENRGDRYDAPGVGRSVIEDVAPLAREALAARGAGREKP